MIKLFTKIFRLICQLPTVLCYISAVSLIAIVAIIFAQIMVRYLFSKSLIPIDEWGGVALLIITFTSLGWVLRQGGHLRISTVVDRIPRKAHQIVGLFVGLYALAFSFYFAFLWYKLTLMSFKYGSAFLMSGMPLWPFQIVGIVGWIGIIIAEVEFIVSHFVHLRSQKEPSEV